ncbi:phosphate acyltransferase PlsX [bacterium]|nr:phosphate acyltransferase PlsX [Oscillospiraceae bacterium]MBR6301235.1 phosphate acyltransferase PlsX [bacterium]
MARIAIDAMGGDYAPRTIVEGALWAAQEYGVGLELVGRQDEIQAEIDRIKSAGYILSDCGTKGHKRRIKIDVDTIDYTISHANEVIGMGEAVGQSIRRKQDSSIVAAVKAVAEGRCEAVVSAGSTGAAMAASLFGLGRIHGVTRPAIAVTLPTMGKPVVLIDGGANSDCTAEMLAQFAEMGLVYDEDIVGVENPRVGILSIGEEEGKGNALVKEAYPLLKDLHEQGRINFVGNIEGKELCINKADVVVCDGFAGNIALKVTEGTASLLIKMISTEFKSDLIGCIVGLMAKPVLRRILKRTNWEGFGGMLLLGVKGISVIAHGRSSSYAMKNAVRAAVRVLNKDINSKIAEKINR